MKISVEEWAQCEEIEVRILCRAIDVQVKRIVELLDHSQDKILVGGEKKQKVFLPQEEIFYIESVDKKVFIYGEEEIYQCEQRLYQLEEKLMEKYFFRISKSLIVNINRVSRLEPEEGRRLKLVLENNERLLVSKRYVQEFKRKLEGAAG